MKVPDNFVYYLSLHEDCNERLLAGADHLMAEDLEVSPHLEVARVKKMVFAVLGEIHRMKAFVRLSFLGSRVLYGFFKPRHKIGEHICDYFARRNPGIIVVLGNGSESWVSLYLQSRIWRDHSGGMAMTLEKLKNALPGSEVQDPEMPEENVEDLWQVFYDSQYCPERKNLAVFRKNMPRRDQEAAGLRLMQNKKNATLEDFFFDESR